MAAACSRINLCSSDIRMSTRASFAMERLHFFPGLRPIQNSVRFFTVLVKWKGMLPLRRFFLLLVGRPQSGLNLTTPLHLLLPPFRETPQNGDIQTGPSTADRREMLLTV